MPSIRKAREQTRTVVCASHLKVLAVDVPTGLSGSSSGVPGPVMPADLTVTFAALKLCHVLPPACLHCGEVAVAEIGIPEPVLEAGSGLSWVEADDIALLLPSRRADSHKGGFGHLLIVAGAEGRGGAVAMAAQAAVAAARSPPRRGKSGGTGPC